MAPKNLHNQTNGTSEEVISMYQNRKINSVQKIEKKMSVCLANLFISFVQSD